MLDSCQTFFGWKMLENAWQPPSILMIQNARKCHSDDILGARMLWKPKEARILKNFIDQPV
jgi:hypothetical protein